MNFNFVGMSGIPLQPGPRNFVEDMFASMLKKRQEEQAMQKGEYENQYLKAKGSRAEDVIQSEIDRNKAGSLYQAMLAKYLGPEKESEAAYRAAQTNRLNKQNESYDEEVQSEIDERKARTESYKSGRGKGGSISQTMRKWNSYPKDVQRNMIAQAKAYGYSEDEALNEFLKDRTLPELKEEARENGMDVDNAQPIFSATQSNITKQKEMDGALAELNVLEDFATKAMGKNINTIMGYSPKQFVDSLFGMNEDEQADYLAARAVFPEISGSRSRLAGGSNAHEALREITNTSFGNAKVFQPLVSERVYNKMQERIQEKFNEANKARQNVIYGSSMKKSQKGEYNYNDYSASEKLTAKKAGLTPAQVREYLKIKQEEQSSGL